MTVCYSISNASVWYNGYGPLIVTPVEPLYTGLVQV